MSDIEAIAYFKSDLKALLEKHNVKLSLQCYDMEARLAFDTSDSVDNFLASCQEDKFGETIVNKCI